MGYVVRVWVSFRETDIYPPRNCRGVSLIHVSVVIPLAIRCLDSPTLSADRAFGWDERVGTVFAVAAGYFLWDTIDMILHFEAYSFVAHGSWHPHDIRPLYALTRGNSAGAACFFVYFLCFVSLQLGKMTVSDASRSAHFWLITLCGACSGRGKSINPLFDIGCTC